MKQNQDYKKRNLVFTLIFAVIFSFSSLFAAAGDNGKRNVSGQQLKIEVEKGNKYGQLRQELHGYFSQLYEDREFSGTVLVAKDGKLILMRGYGMANYENGKPNNPATVFPIASMTKQFTAICILMLEERGILNIHDPVSKYIPDFPRGDVLTLKNLMDHTSGLYNFFAAPELWTDGNYQRYHTPLETFSYFYGHPYEHEVGAQWLYCNSGYLALGVIIEDLTGMTYRDFLEENIFKPLKMRSSSYDPDEIDHRNRVATGYVDIKDDNPVESDYLHPTVAYSAGGIFSTVMDMYKWDRALNTEILVSNESLRRIFTPGLGNYGLGWWVYEPEINGKYRKHIYHTGGYIGYHSIISRWVDDDLTIIVLDNTHAPTWDNETFDYRLRAREIAAMILD